MADTPVWFITGCSTGFGRELAKRVIGRGWRVVATARDRDAVTDLADGAEDNVLALALDVTDEAQIRDAVQAAKDRFGRIDVLVNNAGYGYISSAEEGEDARIRTMFDTNVFGLFAVTRAVLPLMRAARRGHVINISSVAGLVGFVASGYYSATKHAVEGHSKALAEEVAPLGIKVSCVEPGPFRTDFAGRSIQVTPTRIDDYAETVGKREADLQDYDGKQAGDPVRAADAMIALTERADPPLHFVLGRFGMDTVTDALEKQLAEIEAGREAGLATDYPDA